MSGQPNSMQALFAEMMRRRVFRVMAVYGAVAFVVLQVADIVLPALGLPEWAMSLVLVLTLLGFPIAMVLAWAFETTPEGMRRTVPAAPEEIQQIVAAPRKHRWPAGLLALAGLGLLFWAGWYMGNRGAENPANILVPEAQASGFKAIAALPFENVNGDEDNRLIAMGVHDDLNSQLQRIAALRVTAGSSVREYEDTDKTFAQIADELGVDYLLEGSVRSTTERVRVIVSLVDASTAEQLWTATYDEDFTTDNLFDIQSRIARQVVDALEAEVTPRDQAALASMEPASSLAAQSWYYRGVEEYAGGVSQLPAALEALQRSVQIDPDFTAAWSYLTRVASRLVFLGQDDESATARSAMERTAELAPGSVEAHLAAGFYEYYAQRDFDAALAAFRDAEALAPSDAEVVWGLGLILRRQGDWATSTDMMKRAVQLDPRNVLRLETLAENLEYLGLFEGADAVTERQLALDPLNTRARARKIDLLIERDGNTERARTLAAELGLDPAEPEEAAGLQSIAFFDRDFETILDLSKRPDTGGVDILERRSMILRLFARAKLGQSDSVSALADSVLDRLEAESVWAVQDAAIRAFVNSRAGRRDEALEAAQLTEEYLEDWDDHVTGPGFAVGLVGVYGDTGELDSGFALLDDLVEQPDDVLTVTGLRHAGIFDAYRDDPRFEEIIERREAFEARHRAWAETRRPWLP